MKKTNNYSVYILECRDKSYYTGISKDVENRIKLHNGGKGAKYTRTRCPVRLVYLEAGFNNGDALRRERTIKKYKRADKLELIEEYKSSNSI
jgi:predicted GIY-YIG superfamily endonuclease